jgi:hypothetical protein
MTNSMGKGVLEVDVAVYQIHDIGDYESSEVSILYSRTLSPSRARWKWR